MPDSKQIPYVSSQTTGPLGAAHLPRLWTKLTLASKEKLAEGWDECGKGFDQMTIDNLGLQRDKVVDYIRTHKPTYVQFEEWVKAHGKTDKATIDRHNDSIHGYDHSPDTASSMRDSLGLKDDSVNDAVTLNSLDDLHELHKQVHAG